MNSDTPESPHEPQTTDTTHRRPEHGMKRLILVGGGHAHLAVMRAFATARPAGLETVLITPSAHQYYSGMLPGWIAGHYAAHECRIDLRALARMAPIRMETNLVTGIDAPRRNLTLADGTRLDYDLLSIDVGSEIDVSWLELAGSKLLPVKPLDAFLAAWPRTLASARRHNGYRLVVVGGGAAGVELALATRHALAEAATSASVELVVSESGLLPGHGNGVKRRVTRYLQRAGIAMHRHRAVGVAQGVMLSNTEVLPADCVLAATGARAPMWLTDSGLQLDRDGYIAVDAHHRSLSHPEVYAVGDVCARQDQPVARSGVHAVHAGPVLAANLLAALAGHPLIRYTPRKRSLYLLACGPRHAIASWGNLSAEGAWVWRWKDRIDRNFIERHSSHPTPRHPLPFEEAS